MSYSVRFVINGRKAELDENFSAKRDAQEAAAGIEQEGYNTEIIQT